MRRQPGNEAASLRSCETEHHDIIILSNIKNPQTSGLRHIICTRSMNKSMCKAWKEEMDLLHVVSPWPQLLNINNPEFFTPWHLGTNPATPSFSGSWTK